MHHLDVFEAIADGSLTPARYGRLLQSLMVFHALVGAGAALAGCRSLSSAARRLVLLDSDLRSLGHAPPTPATAWRPRSRPAALGALYAAEGSMLGGRVIAGQLDFLFGAGLRGRRFFIGSKADGGRWRNLLAVLETECSADKPLAEAIDGASFAFGLFEQCVTRRGERPRVAQAGGNQY